MTLRPWILCCLLLLPSASVIAKEPQADILGVRLGMTEEDAHRRLLKVGSPDTSQAESDEAPLWKLRDRRFASLLVHFGRDGRVEWVTAYAREGGRRLRYGDVADTSLARHTGFHIYTWTVAGKGSRPGYVLTARGKTPEYLSSLSLSPLPPAPPDSSGARRR